MVHHRLLETNASRVRLPLEDFRVSVRRRRLNSSAITHPPEKCLVRQIVLIQVGGKNNQLLERNLNLFSGVQRQEIDASFERNYPAIQTDPAGDTRWRPKSSITSVPPFDFI